MLQQLGPPIGSSLRTSAACPRARVIDIPIPSVPISSVSRRFMPGGQQIPLQDLAPIGPFPLDPAPRGASDLGALLRIDDQRPDRRRPVSRIARGEDHAVLTRPGDELSPT